MDFILTRKNAKILKKNSFLLNKVFVAASKPIAKRNKIVFILYARDSPPLNSRAKIKTSFSFLFFFRCDSVN